MAILLAQCANESVPQGGKKDEKPPEVKKINPANKSVHFSGNKIEITFNEFIAEGGFAQTLISPPLDKRPEYKVSGKTLTVKLKSPLRDSTTYTINFAQDIKDVNEANIANNFTYVFSTGDYIDSQKIGGSIVLADDNSVQDGVVVSLYPLDSLDGIAYAKPYYFTRTDKSGKYKIENIKAGQYRIYALKDQNYNYVYDQPNELIGFADSLVVLNDTIAGTADLSIFRESRGVKLDELNPVGPGLIRISYTKPITNFKLESELKTNNDFYYYNETGDTIYYWYRNYHLNKAQLVLTVNDTLQDTARIELKFMAIDSLSRNREHALSIVNQSNKVGKDTGVSNIYNVQELFKPLKINFTRPIAETNESKALQLKDSTGKILPVKFTIYERTHQILFLEFEKTENTPYILEIPDSIFRDVLGTWNRRVVYKFQTNAKENYGNINLTLKAKEPNKNYIIRIINAAGETVKEISFTGETERKETLTNLLSGAYKVSIIDDRNHNGRWDTGNFKDKIQPEKIYTIKDTYQLKGGWDLDVEVNF